MTSIETETIIIPLNSNDFMLNIYGNKNCKNLLVTYGRLFSYACKAKEKLAEMGIEICILKLCKIKPIDKAAVQFASEFKNIWFFAVGFFGNLDCIIVIADFFGIFN